MEQLDLTQLYAVDVTVCTLKGMTDRILITRANGVDDFSQAFEAFISLLRSC